MWTVVKTAVAYSIIQTEIKNSDPTDDSQKSTKMCMLFFIYILNISCILKISTAIICLAATNNTQANIIIQKNE